MQTINMMNLNRITQTLLLIYAALILYATVSAISGIGYDPILTPSNTLLAFSFAVAHGSLRLGWKSTLMLLAITFTTSLVFESFGVATGWVYGSYHYTDKLGLKFLGLVPLLVPLAWFMMSYPAFILARRIVRAGRNLWIWRLSIAGIGALIMTAWDLAMDPMMVSSQHWIWDQPGEYFNIPLQNFWGWWLTIFVAFLLYLVLKQEKPSPLDSDDPGFDRLAVLSYAMTGMSTIIVDFNIGLSGPAMVGFFAMLPWVVVGIGAEKMGANPSISAVDAIK